MNNEIMCELVGSELVDGQAVFVRRRRSVEATVKRGFDEFSLWHLVTSKQGSRRVKCGRIDL